MLFSFQIIGKLLRSMLFSDLHNFFLVLDDSLIIRFLNDDRVSPQPECIIGFGTFEGRSSIISESHLLLCRFRRRRLRLDLEEGNHLAIFLPAVVVFKRPRVAPSFVVSAPFVCCLLDEIFNSLIICRLDLAIRCYEFCLYLRHARCLRRHKLTILVRL